MILEGGVTKTKVVNLEKLCNFIVENFFIWNHLSNENYVWILIFEIQNFQMTSDGETTKTKLLDLKKLCNFELTTFSFKIIYPRKITFEFPHIWNSNYSNDLRWRNDQNQSCRSRKVIKLYSWQLFHFNLFKVSNFNFKTRWT
jgi:hypothetical protein